MKQGILQSGMATVSGDLLIGVNAICVPIFNIHDEVEFCIAALGAESQLPIDVENKKVKALKATAKALTEHISCGQKRLKDN